MNSFNIIGRLTRDPESSFTKAGKQVAKFSIAHNHRFGKDTSFFNCECWEKTADTVVKYLKKGSHVAIEGEGRIHSWDDKDGKKQSRFLINVRNFDMLDKKPEGESQVSQEVKQHFETNPFLDEKDLF